MQATRTPSLEALGHLKCLPKCHPGQPFTCIQNLGAFDSFKDYVYVVSVFCLQRAGFNFCDVSNQRKDDYTCAVGGRCRMLNFMVNFFLYIIQKIKFCTEEEEK
jgi:hypothetical protein